MATREKNVWILILFILCGLVVGGLLGQLASSVDFYGGYHMDNNLEYQIQ